MPRLLVTEEPENGIHPRAIETVVQSLGMLYDSQVWVSTHSPIVLAHTELPTSWPPASARTAASPWSRVTSIRSFATGRGQSISARYSPPECSVEA